MGLPANCWPFVEANLRPIFGLFCGLFWRPIWGQFLAYCGGRLDADFWPIVGANLRTISGQFLDYCGDNLRPIWGRFLAYFAAHCGGQFEDYIWPISGLLWRQFEADLRLISGLFCSPLWRPIWGLYLANFWTIVATIWGRFKADFWPILWSIVAANLRPISGGHGITAMLMAGFWNLVWPPFGTWFGWILTPDMALPWHLPLPGLDTLRTGFVDASISCSWMFWFNGCHGFSQISSIIKLFCAWYPLWLYYRTVWWFLWLTDAILDRQPMLTTFADGQKLSHSWMFSSTMLKNIYTWQTHHSGLLWPYSCALGPAHVMICSVFTLTWWK